MIYCCKNSAHLLAELLTQVYITVDFVREKPYLFNLWNVKFFIRFVQTSSHHREDTWLLYILFVRIGLNSQMSCNVLFVLYSLV